jgi:hypothetical protein
MGLLDEAIREHLDLKRRRGADPAEVERAEREALGPVRRVAEGQADAEAVLEFAQPAAEVYDLPPESEFAEEPDFGGEPDFPEPEFAGDAGDGWHEPYAVPDESPPPVAPPPVAPEPVHERPVEPVADPAIEHAPEQPAPPADESASDRLFFESEPEHEAPPEAPYEQPGGETVEYDVEHALEEESAGGAVGEDDVLEETPEFLQDTPDHDRLWFEQKPPRDFDFDG